MANASCVDSEIFYKKLGDVKASKKANKIALFVDDNFYDDAMKGLETGNEDSKDKTITKRKGWKLEAGKIIPTTEKKLFKNVTFNIAHKGRVSIPRSNTTLCVTVLKTRRTRVDHQQKKTARSSPYSSKRIPNTFANGPNGP